MLSTKYDHVSVEKGKYQEWLKAGYFKSGDLTKKPFCIVIPPPNVTGKLHLGHAWDTGIQDTIIRYKRMQGYDTLWVPGMDHAGIATQAKIDKKLKAEGKNPREMSREEWLKVAWKWKEEYAENIHQQWAKLGLSLDYDKERFTLDDGLSEAVKHVFVTLYNKGLIYRGERIINWDPEAMTALSNEEVIYKEVKGAFYHLKYYLEDSDDYLEIATTRPETLFGDTAVAVNPDDERYQKYIGKNVILPLVNKKIPVVADLHADPNFGTGVVKITPAHDPNDFEVGLRHNLPRVVVINPDGTMNDNALEYAGMDRFKCREELVKDLKAKNLLIKIEKITHSVGHSERTDVMVEPYLSKQWFVKMRPLADAVLANQKKKDKKVNFVPRRFEKIMNHWMTITYDWCISRQLWWGHRIPAWYRKDEIYVGVTPPAGDDWHQDEDVLDTWFSSALWPFSTLGFPEDTELLKRYYPNDVLVTAYDIIPFWVNRMTFQGLEFMGERPFKECLIHGLIRDKDGRKMSKSLGNGIDPMDVIAEYGSDSLRYYLVTATSLGMDLRYDTEKVKATWNFINKLWNASRFCLLNMENFTEKDYALKNLTQEDEWIITKLNLLIKDVIKYMDKYEFNNVASRLYSFIWNDFCDTYIEFAKFNLEKNSTKSTLYYVILNILKMLHPFMPYVTSEIYDKLPFKDASNIMISKYPTYNKKMLFATSLDKVEHIIDFIKVFRNIKQENNIDSSYKVKLQTEFDPIILKILKLDSHIIEDTLTITKYNVTNNYYTLDLYYEKVLSEEDKLLQEKQIENLKNSIARREKLLANEGYLNKAPKELIASEREKLANEKSLLDKLMN